MTAFLRGLVRRGLKGVELVISDSNQGLRSAMAKLFTGIAWQRCRVHLMRNVLAHVPKGDKSMAAAAMGTIFPQHNQEAARQQLAKISQAMEPRWPKVAEVLTAGEDDVLTYMTFPPEHWTRIHSPTRPRNHGLVTRRLTDWLLTGRPLPDRTANAHAACHAHQVVVYWWMSDSLASYQMS